MSTETETQTEAQAAPSLADMDIPPPPGASPGRWRGVLRGIDELAAKHKAAEDGRNEIVLTASDEDFITIVAELDFRRANGEFDQPASSLVANAIRELDQFRESTGRAQADAETAQAEKFVSGIKFLVEIISAQMGPGIATQFETIAQNRGNMARAFRFLFDCFEGQRAKAVAQAATAAREEARRTVQSVIEAIHGPESAVASRSITSLADLAAFAIRPNREPFTLPAATRAHLAEVASVTSRLKRTTGMAALTPEEIRSILDASIDGTV